MSSLRLEGAPANLRRLAAILVAVLLAAALPSCSSGNPTIPDVVAALLQVTVDPNPVIGLQNPLNGSVSVSYRITIQELNGLGGQFQFVSSTIYDPATGLQAALNYYDSSDLKVFVGTDRIDPQGTLVVPQSVTYTLSDLGTATNMTVSVQLIDDRENLITRSILVPVQ
jgi:hypothetical protein